MPLRNTIRSAHQRIRQDTCDTYCLMSVQTCSSSPIVFLCSNLYPEQSFTCFDYIQIYLHYPFLTPEQLNENRIISLESFSPPALSTEGETIFCDLLTDCTAPTYLLSLELMFLLHFDEFPKIKAPMFHKSSVFRSHDCSNHNRRNILDIHPSVSILISFLSDILYSSLEHQRCPLYRYILIQQYP